MWSEWLRSLRYRAPSDTTELLTDTLPGLLGVPEDASFNILARSLYHSDPSDNPAAAFDNAILE
jgi:hypothetical protein